MHKKHLLVIGALVGLVLLPIIGRADFFAVQSDGALASVTPAEYNSIVYTLWDLYRDQSTNFWGIDEKNPDVTLDVNGAVKFGDSGQSCTTDTRGVISYHMILPDTEPHFWGCNGTSWQQLDGIPIN